MGDYAEYTEEQGSIWKFSKYIQYLLLYMPEIAGSRLPNRE